MTNVASVADYVQSQSTKLTHQDMTSRGFSVQSAGRTIITLLNTPYCVVLMMMMAEKRSHGGGLAGWQGSTK